MPVESPAKDALVRSERELSDFFETASIGLHWVGPDGVILRVNQAELDMLGYSREEYVGRNIVEFHVDQPVIADILGCLTAGEVLKEYPARLWHKDGTIRDVLISSSARFIDGEFVHTRCFTIDVTERKRAEQDLRDSEQHLRLALEAGRMGSWEWTLATNEIVWSPRLEAIHGLEPGTFGRTLEAYLADIHPEDLEKVKNAIARTLESGDEHFIEYRIIWPDGTVHWLERRGKLFRDQAGNPERMLGICADITDRKQAEESLSNRARAQTSLYELTDRLNRSEDLEEVYESALDSIIRGLGCDRASLLLFDEHDVLRFVAWRGISDDYRRATEGHSPWTRAETDPAPICVPDFELADFSESLASAVRAEGIRALCFIPLLTDARLIGKFMIYYDIPHELTEQEIELALTIGRQLASGIEHKQSENALQISEHNLRLALDAGRMGTWEWKVGSDTVRWSPALEAIYGFEPGAFPGTLEAYQASAHPDDKAEMQAAIQRSLESGSEHDIQHRIVWPDGSIHWVEGRGKVIRDEAGKPVRMLGVTTDITDRKRAEEDIRFLASASSSLSSIADDEETLRKLANLAVPGFADWCSVDMIAQDGSLKRVAVAHTNPAKVELAHALQEKYPPRPDEGRGVWQVIRTGQSEMVTEITDELLVASIPDEEFLGIVRELGLKSYMAVPLTVRGKVLGVITFIGAESGRRYGPDELAIAEDLAHRAAVAIENGRLYQELREADRRKDTFLATLAHELRNPLAPMRHAVEIIENAGDDANLITQARAMVDRQLAHMVRLIDDLLDISRITMDKLVLQKSRVDVAALIQQACESLRPSIEAQGHTLELLLPEGPMALQGDPTRLTQVLSNLLNNAAKFTNSGGLIRLSAKRVGPHVEIRIEDNGVGISAEMLPRVFDMFTQADHTTDRLQSGLGIGLSLVKRLVELHGGSIKASSKGTGQGSEFVVRLPLLEVDSTQERPSPTEGVNLPTRHRILVVDDNADAARMFSAMLEMWGHETVTAYDGEEAVARAEACKPEIILMDIGLPKLNGYEAATKIREQAWGKPMILVAVTGWGQDEDRQKSRSAGFDAHLVKPVGYDTLQKLIGELTNKAMASKK